MGSSQQETGWNIPAVEYVFPQGSEIAPGGVFLVARNPEQFRARYGELKGIPLFGPYRGKLSNSGEDLRLRGSGWYRGKTYYPETIDVVKYRDHAPWPAGTDGDGLSLELRDLSLDNDYGQSWAASQGEGGTPGKIPGDDLRQDPSS